MVFLFKKFKDKYNLNNSNKFEQINCFISKLYKLLFSQLHGTGALVIAAMLDFLTFALCAPYSETTDGTYFDTLLEMVANEGRVMYKLFQVCKVSFILRVNED